MIKVTLVVILIFPPVTHKGCFSVMVKFDMLVIAQAVFGYVHLTWADSKMEGILMQALVPYIVYEYCYFLSPVGDKVGVLCNFVKEA